jgi:short-subunit dehydrogenase
MLKLEGQTALITGAASGLGRELALALAAQGCGLYLVDRDLAGLRDLQRHHPDNMLRVFGCDLADPAQRAGLIAALTSEAPGLNLLINCAGIGSHSSLRQLSPGEVHDILQVNTLAAMELTAGLYPLLAQGPAGCIVNIGSTAGEVAVPSMGAYCASKAALHAFSRSITAELAGTRVRCLLVILGSLRATGFAQSIRHPMTGQPGWYRRLDSRPADAAQAIVAAIQRGQSELIYPKWYGQVLWAARMCSALLPLMTKTGYRRLKPAKL